jgi:bifunctional non-homologous end joining protein LigD
VLGVYRNGKLEPVGRVGTGFSAPVAADLFKRPSRMRTDESPFGRKLTAEEARQARYVRPEMVAEVEFRAWTGDGHLRHASFRGLREDKPAKEVVAEMPKLKTAPGSKPDKPPRRTVRLTHLDRVYWPEEGVTKEGLADYYSEVWRYIAPHIVGRPLALLRAPSGIEGRPSSRRMPRRASTPRSSK